MANETKLENIINPEVLADMVSAQLPNALQVTSLYKVDRTLEGKAGNTITVPQWDYIGAAEDLAEGTDGTITQMSAQKKEYTVKKAVKNIELTDEARLSGYGNPEDEAAKQLRMAIQDKIDNDGIELLKAFETHKVTAEGKLTYDVVCDALDTLGDEEQGGDLYLLTGQEGIKNLRRDSRFIDAHNDLSATTVETGVVGLVAGCKVKISNKLNGVGTGVAFVMKPNPITAFIKRDVNVETARDVLKKSTIISADEHYVCAIEDATKIVRIDFNGAAA